MDKQAVEAQLCQLPISQYAWIDPQTIEFSDRIRYVCEHECPMYGTSWACPPAVGTVAACRERILSYPGALVFTTLSEVDDIADLSAALATRAPHEAVTRQVRDILRQFSPDVLTPSAPNAPGRRPPAATRNGCSPAWRATASSPRPSPSRTASNFITATSSPGFRSCATGKRTGRPALRGCRFLYALFFWLFCVRMRSISAWAA